ncbi:MAG TPA: ROK family transcriptional regulator [Vicinamibacterales bacterium]|nr:ROK family transcriptional regulator [Vicinamibacterales bacterium]
MPAIPITAGDSVRDVNRHLILGLIRARQPISRADLARQTGLQPSTVSLITEQLIGQRWVTEGAAGQAARGRKPRLLYLNVERARILGVDVRPTVTTIAIADPNGRVIAYERMPTARLPGTFVRNLCRRLQAFLRAHPRLVCEGIGVTVPGGVDHARQRLVSAPNLGWRDVDLKAPIEQATGIPVELENAANACAIAEASFGNHRDARDLVVVTVSEGIGTGIISGGRLVRGASGLAGEFGHVSLDERGPLCSCGRRGCWEVYASNAAALSAYTHGARAVPAGRAQALTFDQLLTRAEQGDGRAAAALSGMGDYLGRGIAMLATGLAPSLILVVGEVTRAWPIVGPSIEKSATARSSSPLPRIVPAGDGAEARLRGTVALGLQKQFGTAIVA